MWNKISPWVRLLDRCLVSKFEKLASEFHISMASDTSDTEEFYDAPEDVNFTPSPKV